MQSTGYILCVKNLPPSMTADRFRQLFLSFGEVRWARLISASGTIGGYVEMGSQEEATRAMVALNNTTIEGHTVMVSL